MKPWWQVVKPHRDIREGRLDEAVFAADLGDVLSQKGPVDYRDPETFFTRTYLPKGLANLLSGITSRLCGEKGSVNNSTILSPSSCSGKISESCLFLTHLEITSYHILIEYKECA